MRVALVTPWDNAWVPMYREAIQKRGHEFVHLKKAEAGHFDVVIHGWMTDAPMISGARNVMFLRRYELFTGVLNRVRWDSVEHLICVNRWIAEVVKSSLGRMKVKTPVSTIYNAVDTKKWTFKKRKKNNKVGMSCHVHPKKNLPLALQILAKLPEGYELHIAGEIQDPCTAEYLNHVGNALRRRIYLYGHIDRRQLDVWWEAMGVCLSTSLSEGNPNNVIEAMAKGVKPVVHYWPGAEEQFPGNLFGTVDEAVQMILSDDYDSERYLKDVQLRYSLSNIERAVDIALQQETETAWHPV